MAKIDPKLYELSELVMRQDRQLKEYKDSYQSMLVERNKYLSYSQRLENLLYLYNKDWFETFKDK